MTQLKCGYVDNTWVIVFWVNASRFCQKTFNQNLYRELYYRTGLSCLIQSIDKVTVETRDTMIATSGRYSN